MDGEEHPLGPDDQLVERMLLASPIFELIELDGSKNQVRATSRKGERLFIIEAEGPSWVFRTTEGHAHRDSFEEAVQTAVDYLEGNSAFVEEFRGDQLACGWMISLDEEDDSWVSSDLAVFLCPFDADEWVLWPGEKWRHICTGRTLDPDSDEITLHTTESEVDCSSNLDTVESFGRMLCEGLRAPQKGLKWTINFDHRLVFQAPSGWRRIPAKSPKDRWIDLAPPSGGFVFRVRQYYRPTEHPTPMVEHAVGPLSISPSLANGGPDWRGLGWELTFSDGETDMMGIFEFFYREGSEYRPHEELIASVLESALYASDGWG